MGLRMPGFSRGAAARLEQGYFSGAAREILRGLTSAQNDDLGLLWGRLNRMLGFQSWRMVLEGFERRCRFSVGRSCRSRVNALSSS